MDEEEDDREPVVNPNDAVDVTDDYYIHSNVYRFKSVPHHLQELAKREGRSIKLQDVAYAKAHEYTPALIVMARQMNEQGTREYWVGSWFSLYKAIMFIPPEDRTFYEMIPTGRDCPVNIYFDLEAYPLHNKEVDFSTFLESFLKACKACIKKYLPSHVSSRPTRYIVLNSTNETKISYHVIVRIEGFAFKDMFCCGRFALLVMHMLDTDPSTKSMFFAMIPSAKKLEEGRSTDMGVYSEFRNFRLFGNTKYKKNCGLWTQDRYDAIQKGDRKAKLFERTTEGMHEWGKAACTYFTPEERSNLHVIGFDLPDEEDTELYRWIQNFEQRYHRLDKIFTGSETLRGKNQATLSFLNPPVYSHMPFLENPAFNPSEPVRRPVAFPQGGLPPKLQNALVGMFSKFNPRSLSFDLVMQQATILTHSKQCMILNKEHKGNKVYFVARIGRDPRSRSWIQKCKNCTNKSTKPEKFPPNIDDMITEYWNEQDPVLVSPEDFLGFLSQHKSQESSQSSINFLEDCSASSPTPSNCLMAPPPSLSPVSSRSSDVIFVGEKRDDIENSPMDTCLVKEEENNFIIPDETLLEVLQPIPSPSESFAALS